MDIVTLGWGSFFATVTFSIALVIWGRNGFQMSCINLLFYNCVIMENEIIATACVSILLILAGSVLGFVLLKAQGDQVANFSINSAMSLLLEFMIQTEKL